MILMIGDIVLSGGMEFLAVGFLRCSTTVQIYFFS